MVVVENRQGNSDAKRMNFKSWEAAGVQDQSRAEWPLPAEEEEDRDRQFFSVVKKEERRARPCYASELPCDRGMLDPSLPWSPAMLPLLPQSPLRVLGAPPSSAPRPPPSSARGLSAP